MAAWRDKDIEFVGTMIEYKMVDQDHLLKLAGRVPNPEDDLGLSARIKARIERLFSDRGKAVSNN